MVYCKKWNWRFVEILNQHPIIWHPSENEENTRIYVKEELTELTDKKYDIHSKEYNEIIYPMFNYFNGYTKSVSGYKNYTKSDMIIFLGLMDKYLALCKKAKMEEKLEAIKNDF